MLKTGVEGTPTITLTNLGNDDGDKVFGVIHPPQVVLVGFGRGGSLGFYMLGARPVARNSLAADHLSLTAVTAPLPSIIDRLLSPPETR